jgi:pyruvate formate-lyase activating enzyme-like uncharacterized protein
MTALRLIKYVLDNHIGLSINYCAPIYKHRFQKKGYRERLQSYIKEDYENLTEYGFIRRLSIQDIPVNIERIINVFKENKYTGNLWFFNENNNKLFFHHSLLKNIDFSKYDLIINYFTQLLAVMKMRISKKSR